MDLIDLEIIDHLRRDGRLTNTELARQISLSPTPTLRRVRALERSGVIMGYHASIDPAQVNQGFQVLVWITLAGGATGAIDRFEEAVTEIDEVIEADRLFGDPDYLLRVACADAVAYEDLYITKIAALPGVDRVKSQIAMKSLKAHNS